jgi:thiamine-monophosphate kinase
MKGLTPLPEKTSLSGKSVYDWVMGDSDDYELIITCPPEKVGDVRSVIGSISHIPVTEVGRIIPESEGVQLIMPNNKKQKITPKGWDHFI